MAGTCRRAQSPGTALPLSVHHFSNVINRKIRYVDKNDVLKDSLQGAKAKLVCARPRKEFVYVPSSRVFFPLRWHVS